MTRFEIYQRGFLDREGVALAKANAEPAPGAELFSFQGRDLPAALVADRFALILRLLAGSVQRIPSMDDLLQDDGVMRQTGEFWQKQLPDWFTTQFGASGDAGGALAMFLTDFSLCERCWFYAGHRLRCDVLEIAIERSEQPCGTYSLVALAQHCGGSEVMHGRTGGARGWLSLFRRKSRSKSRKR